MNAIALKKALVQFQIKETVAVLGASVVFPFLIHLIPPIRGIPLGARFLPMFYAPFIAIVLFRPHVAALTGFFAPVLNSLLTGHPLPEKVSVLTVELLLFCAISYLIRLGWRRFPVVAPLAYLISVFCLTSLSGRFNLFLNTIAISLPGVAALFLLNIILLRMQTE